jgi:glycosyltransferase involved in cell wall biosynthesis
MALRVVLVANALSIHAKRWLFGLIDRKYETHLITCHSPCESCISDHTKILPYPPGYGYYCNVFHLNKMLKLLKPDIVHVHYASGYGTLMRLTRYRPYILSVWGSDVFEYPDRSTVCLWRVRKNLKSAAEVCATSNVMARRTMTLCPQLSHIHVTPFGIDIGAFRPTMETRDSSCLTVGTVKTLERGYAVDILLRAFAKAKEQLSDNFPELAHALRLRITGQGSEESNLKKLAASLGIEHITYFQGAVPHASVAAELNRLDIYLAVSRCEESFGVAVLEASACAVPVIVSDRGGLPEVVEHERTGIIVPAENVEQTAQAIVRLATNPQLRKEMGEAGRRFVCEKYDWQVSLDIMENVYRDFIAKHR